MTTDQTTPDGTITFWATAKHPNGLTDSSVVRFPPLSHGSVRVTSVKNPDGKIAINIEGLHGRSFAFNEPIPPCDARGLFVVITWTPQRVTLNLNGQEAQHIDIPVQ